ncbi:hypothetical protein CS390_23080 [Pseudomonas sp. HLS-6]|uniref:hypothetical protein n=1 Tax=Pseudomonas sp. HLS-6 TaxID=2049589 RepID=UPI000C1A0C26|nr:hypothetical protein [Pseudomonas sp. HLS-6]ATR85197.1 hypothetical protein CS390_23080 [Pseudomonas sp. HLS-6]
MSTTRPDYQDVLKFSALHYLKRHQAEHLSGDDRLFVRAVCHLVADHNVSDPTAERAVYLAMNDLGLGVADRSPTRAART